MRHQKKLDKVTAPAARFQGWKAMPLGSKIAVVVLVAQIGRASCRERV